MNHSAFFRFLLIPFLAAVLAPVPLTAEPFETPPTLTLEDIWGEADWLKTELYQVLDQVTTDHFLHHYLIDSLPKDSGPVILLLSAELTQQMTAQLAQRGIAPFSLRKAASGAGR